MNMVYERCAGMDVHKRNVVVCAIPPDVQGQRQKEQRTLSTMMPDLLRMRQWFQSRNVTHVAMERTGSFWKGNRSFTCWKGSSSMRTTSKLSPDARPT
jgi:transposase